MIPVLTDARANRSPYLFRSYPSPQRPGAQPGGNHCAVWEAGRATSAAPTYFAPQEIAGRDGSREKFVDGGVKHNNPTIVATNEAQDLWPGRKIGTILSIGCSMTDKERTEATDARALAKRAKESLTGTQPTHTEVLQMLGIESSAAR